jgi:hypothetical protein
MLKKFVLVSIVGAAIGAVACSAVMDHLDEVAKLRTRHEHHLAATHLIAEAMKDMDRRIKRLEKTYDAPEVYGEIRSNKKK